MLGYIHAYCTVLTVIDLPKYDKSGGMNNTVHILGTSVVVIESFACTSITSTYVAMSQFTSKLPLLVRIRRRIMHTNQLEVNVLLPAHLLNFL